MKTYTTVQLAERLGVGRDTIYRWMRAGKIKTAPVSQLGPFRVRLWTERDVARIRAFMQEGYFAGRGRRKSGKGGAE
jgi:predicted site-specific integrase-resolvase